MRVDAHISLRVVEVGVVVGLVVGVGSVEASQVVMLAAGFGEPLIDKLWTVDLSTMMSYVIEM